MQFITTNGQKEVIINPASFKDAGSLKKAVMKCLLGVKSLQGLDIKNLNIDFKGIMDALLELIINIDTSDEFENAVLECLKVCIYDNSGKKVKIVPTMFDDIPEAREDYYEIVAKCCEENLRPFFKSLVSEFKTRFQSQINELPAQE